MKTFSSDSPRRAAIYARQSLSLTEAIDRQIALCKDLCRLRGWDVVEIYEDNDVSASKSRGKGTAWARMLEDIPKDSFDVVVAVDLDRLLRRVADLTLLTDSGIRVLTVNGEIDLTTADGEFRATMLASIAQFETRRKAERQLRANAAKSASGKPVPTRRRYGYDTDGCTPREPEASEVKRIFEEFRKGASIRSLAIDMRSRKVDPGGGKGWPVNRIRWILGNPFYGGQVYHKGVITDSSLVIPIVPKELAIEVRAILADPSRKTSPGSAIRHELTKLMHCGVCKAPMHYMNDYMCSKALDHVSIQKKKIEPVVMWAVRDWITKNEDSQPKESDEIQGLLLKAAELANEAKEIVDMAFWEGIDKAALRLKSQENGKRRAVLEQKIAAARSKNAISQILVGVQAAWKRPIDGTTYADWHKAMIDAADEFGWPVDEEKLTPEAFEQKTRMERSIDDWPVFWRALPLDTRREVIQTIFDIEVEKGRGLERIKISEKVQP